MFTRKAILYFLLATILLVSSLALDDFQLAILVLPIATLLAFTNLFVFPENPKLTLERVIMPSETFGNEQVEVNRRIINQSAQTLQNVEITEKIPSQIKPEKGSVNGHVSLQASETMELPYRFESPPRGLHPVGPLIVRIRDPYGFYMVETRLDEETLTVFPRPDRMRGINIRPRHLGPWPGTIQSRFRGIGSEFYSIRHYVQGDDPKRINWKATARYNTLIINETEAEKVTDIMLVLDTDVGSSLDKWDEFENRVIATASMARLFLRQGNRVGLVLQGQERGSVPAGFGKRHERRILYMLSLARPGKSTIATSYVIDLVARRMLPSRSQIVIITSLLDPEIVEGTRRLTGAGYSLLVITPTMDPPSKLPSKSREIAHRILMLERSNTLLALEKTATVVEWPETQPLSASLSRLKQRRILH